MADLANWAQSALPADLLQNEPVRAQILDALALADRGQSNEAASALESLIEKLRADQDNGQLESLALIALGKVYRGLRWSTAVQHFTKAITLAERDRFSSAKIAALRELGELKCQWGEFRESLELLTQASVLLAPANRRMRRLILLDQSLAYEGLNDLGRAVDLLDQVLDVDAGLTREEEEEDAAHHRRLARALAEEYNLLFERVPCSLAVLDRELRVIRANDFARVRYPGLVGKRCYEAYKKEPTPCVDCPALQTLNDGLIHSSEQMRTDDAGRRSYFLVSTSPLADASNGDSDHVVEMSLDVTDLRRVSDKLEQQRLENARLAAVSQTVTGLAHSIKNILTGLQGGIYDLKVGTRQHLHERIEEGLGAVDRNYQRITDLVRTFLRFSKDHRTQLRPCDAIDIAREVCELYRKVCEREGVHLRLSPDAEPGIVVVDPEAIHTCLSNVVANAFEACLPTTPGTSCSVEIRTARRDDMIDMEVSDTGCGMDARTLEKICTDVFTTKGANGTGLGLLMTKKIIEDHGGCIRFHSELGRGATFTLSLPLRSAEPADHVQTNATD